MDNTPERSLKNQGPVNLSSARWLQTLSSQRLWRLTIPVILLLLLVLIGVTGYIEQWLWMRQLNFSSIFWTILSVQLAMFFATFVISFLFLFSNLTYAAHNSVSLHRNNGEWTSVFWPQPTGSAQANVEPVPVEEFSPALLKFAYGVLSAGIALFFAIAFYSQWDTYIRFWYGGSFEVADPLFGVDAGFYIFHLPFYELLQNSILLLTSLTIIIVAANYVFFGLLNLRGSKNSDTGVKALSHLSALLFLLVADLAWGFYLGHFELLYSTLGVVYGAGFTADHVTQIALWFMVGVSALACFHFAYTAFRVNFKAMAGGACAYAGLWFISLSLIPYFFQEFVVRPNELALETPYLRNSISYTRKAYQLDKIAETSYPAMTDLTQQVLARNNETIQNIRLWDSRPLLQTYQQAQAIRLYYQFYNVATDRYHLADGYHQVMLSTRELSPELPEKAQTWVNQYLQFTHGYGAVMNFVSKTVGGGFPQYIVENLPSESAYGMKIAQPAVYYGQSMPGYRIVSTGIKEFDYPKGNDNVYTSYTGKGGIALDNFWTRMLFAWNKADINILLTGYLKPESKIQIHRNVSERVAQIAPFLRLDSDPYPVLSDGKLYWIQDLYTTSAYYPYGTPQWSQQYGAPAQPVSGQMNAGQPYESGAGSTAVFEGLNYIRNSVKSVVDMYDGTVSFYITDPEDPVLETYRKAFPNVFQNLDKLSPDLKAHLRYPEDLFTVQAEQYRTFHMTDPQVFYNREDLWAAPIETYQGLTQEMKPYYILMKLPGSNELEYLLMTPFTPHGRDNMISWMAARSDFPNYGKTLFYELPKEKLILGPNQIEAMINQNTTISQQLTLWNQNGSRVLKGKQIVTPIENSFLYVVPLYLTAEATNFPQLKRVIAVTGDKVVMEPTLDEAMNALFNSHPSVAATAEGRSAQSGGGAPAGINQAGDTTPAKLQLEDAQKALQTGNWSKFGTAMEGLKQLLASPLK